jgi:hypothetical protein
MRRWSFLAAEAVAWGAVCLGIWVASLSALKGPQLALGLAVAIPCGGLAVTGRLAAAVSWRLRGAWAAPLLTLPLRLVTGTVGIFMNVLPGRRTGGRFTTVALPGASGEGPQAAGRRAAATWLLSVTPGSIVTDIDPATGHALVHVLGPATGHGLGPATGHALGPARRGATKAGAWPGGRR